MSLIPYVFADYYPPRLQQLFDQPFVLNVAPDDLRRQLELAARELESSIQADKQKWEVSLDVQNFAPEEMSVRTVDGYVVVEGKHEERRDEHGFVARQFSRRYALPEGCEPEAVQSRLSSDGVLTVTAPRQLAPQLKGQREVAIQRTGPVRKETKEQDAIQESKKEE